MMRRVALIALAGALALPAQALGSSGALTKAAATSDWGQGDFAGSATWTECAENCESWEAAAFVEPNVYTCSPFDSQESGDPKIQVVWRSGVQHGNGTVEFEVDDVPLDPELERQRACIGVIQNYSDYPAHQPLGRVVAVTLMQIESPPEPPSGPVAEAPTGDRRSPGCVRASRELRRVRKKLRAAVVRGAKPAVLRADRRAVARARARKAPACR